MEEKENKTKSWADLLEDKGVWLMLACIYGVPIILGLITDGPKKTFTWLFEEFRFLLVIVGGIGIIALIWHFREEITAFVDGIFQIIGGIILCIVCIAIVKWAFTYLGIGF